MQRYRIKLKPRAEKSLKKIRGKDYYRILLAIDQLSADPFIGKKLEGEFKGYYAWRIWPYRIIYAIYKNELLVAGFEIKVHTSNIQPELNLFD